jgi:predicted deacetylase
MNRKKKKLVVFSTIILVLVGLLYLFYINQNKIEEAIDIDPWITVGEIKYGLLNLVNANSFISYHNECVDLKYLNQERTIILRMDDIAAWQYETESKVLVSDILKRNLAVSLGVIPEGLENDMRVVNWLREIRKDNKIEIVLHGYNHDPNEFIDLSKKEATLKIIEGKKILKNVIRVEPITFIPPYNEYSSGTIQALEDEGFRVFSAKNDEFDIDKSMISLGFNARTYEFDKERYVPVEEVIENCAKSLDDNGICVIMMHPQDYMRDGEMDMNKYGDFILLLNELKKLDADFKTFKDMLTCI